MPFKIQPQEFTTAFFIDLENTAAVSIQNHGPGDAELAFDEGVMSFIVPMPAGTGYDFPYTGDLLQGRLSCRGKGGANFKALVIKRVFVCHTK